jgi:uncharacterized protein YigA (DUF484 family)
MTRSTGKSATTILDEATADQVAAYLRAHPDFLVQRPDLIQALTPPSRHRGGSVVDFQHFMLERLRTDNVKLREQRQELVNIARNNLNQQARVHAAVLSMLEAQTFEQLIQVITSDLAVRLDVDVTMLIVESNGEDIPHVHRSGVRVVEAGSVDRWIGSRETLLRNNIQGDPDIYGSAAGLVRSEALVRLRVSSETPVGLLAFGSRDPSALNEGQGTELVSFLARTIERCIQAWLDLPP